MKNYQTLQQQYTVNSYPDRQITLVRGEGVYLYDANAEKYLDMMSNYGVSIFGYNHPAITRSLLDQLQKLTVLHGSFNNDTRAIASEVLIKRCGDPYSKVYWANSGTEAIEAALKFAVLKTGKKKFIVCQNGYHGKTLGALSATSGEKYKTPFAPLLWKFVQIPFDDTNALEKAIDKDTAAFIVEPLQGEGGIIVSQNGYLTKVREICDKHGILLGIDEIQTGVGRTGTFLASRKEGVHADILCLGKGLAAGVPVGATVVVQTIADAIQKHMHTSTFGGNPFACAGVLATLGALNEQLLQKVDVLGRYFLAKLRSIKSENIVEARGKGFMIGVAVKEHRNKLLKLMQEKHILVIPAGENVVRFLPPFLITKTHIDKTVEAFSECVASL